MTGENLAFAILAFFAAIAGLYACTAKKLFNLVLAVLAVSGALAGIYFLLGAEFVALMQVIIFTAGIAVMLVFGIMLTHRRNESARHVLTGWSSVAGIAIGLLTVFIVFLFWRYRLLWTGIVDKGQGNSHSGDLTELFFDGYLVPFAVLAVMLLVALIASLVTARKENGAQ